MNLRVVEAAVSDPTSASQAVGPRSPETATPVAETGAYRQARRYFLYDEDIFLPQPKSAPAKPKEVLWPGLGLVLLLTVAATWLNALPVWPFTLADGKHPIESGMLAIMLGMIVSNAWALPASSHAGIKYSVKKLLAIGIVLMGARLHFAQVLALGVTGLIFSVLEIAAALGLMIFFTRRLGISPRLGLLMGMGTAICGGSAIMATAPVIDAEEKDVAFSVATVSLLGLAAMLLLPLLGHLLHLSSTAFGFWAGLSIQQVPQVLAAGFAYSPEAGATATIVKLTRVCLLAPVIFLIGVQHARNKARQVATEAASGPYRPVSYFKLFPTFVLGFLGMALLRTLGLLPDLTLHFSNSLLPGEHTVSTAALADTVAKFCIVMSMAGVGLETKFSSFKQTGWKPFLAGAATFVIVTAALAIVIVLLPIG